MKRWNVGMSINLYLNSKLYKKCTVVNIFLGTFALNNGWVKIIHRKDRCDLSLFQLGLRLLEYFLDHDRPFPVSFAMITPPLE